MKHDRADPTTGRLHTPPSTKGAAPAGLSRRRRPRRVHQHQNCPRCSGFRGLELAILDRAVRTGRMAPRAMTLPGERLARAMLEEAISDFKRGICPDCASPQARHDYLDAYRWFRSTDTDWPLSFENVCYRLNCDATSVRDTIRRVKRAAVEAGCA